MNRFIGVIVLAIGFVCTLPLRVSIAASDGSCQPALYLTYPATGTGPREFNVCLSNEGNVTTYEAPGGFVHVGSAEGYLLCTSEDTYWDLGSLGASGFGPATVSQPKGPGTAPTITRTTTDGAWELKQAFTKDNNEQDLSITTNLKRLSTQLTGPVYLARYANVRMEGTEAADFADVSVDSVLFREARALTLTAQSLGTLPRFGAVGAPPLVFGGGNPTPSCRPTTAATPFGPGDVAGVIAYDMGNYNPSQNKSVRFVYQRK